MAAGTDQSWLSAGQHDARNSAPRALIPASAPSTASPAVLRARACSAAATPEMATTMSLTTKVA